MRRMWFTLKCPVCGSAVTSRHRHDFRWCSCGSLFVDGGTDYLRMGGIALEQFQNIKRWAGRKHGFVAWNYRRPDPELSELFSN